MRHNSANAWEHVKQGFWDSYEALSDAYYEGEVLERSPFVRGLASALCRESEVGVI